MVEFNLRSFLIGSSVAIFPMIYLGLAYNKLSCEEASLMKVKYANLVMFMPIMYGFVYMVLSSLIPKQYILIGAIAGELYSLMGHFLLRIPETLLKSKNPNSVHVIAPILYSLIYGTFVRWLEKKIS
jgi:hypothetical protein